MKKKLTFLPALWMLISLLLTACSGLIPLEKEPVTGEFGPARSSRERQTRTFEALWKNIQDGYIYYDTADVDWNALHDEYLGKINSGLSSEQFTSLLQGLESDLPQGSFIYQPRAERVETDLADATTYDGIGAFVGFQDEEVPHIVILAVIEGSPAEAAGLKAHDSILSIDGSPILLDEGLRAVDRIRGPAGSSVTLGVRSPGQTERPVQVERAKLTSTGKLQSQILPGTNYGYLLFPPVGYTGLDQDVGASLQSLSANGKLDGLILDLRIANSSRGWPLETLATLFEDGQIGELYNRTQKQAIEVTGQDTAGSQTLPLVVLVGKNTIGFTEILAASLQMNKRAVIIGEPTPGSVETQSSFYLPDGSRMFVQSTSFRLSNGEELGNRGVIPDVQVQAGWDQILPNNDPVLKKAVEVLGSSK